MVGAVGDVGERAASAADELQLDAQDAADWCAASERLAPYPTFATPDGPVFSEASASSQVVKSSVA